jgi:hypothetical protein
MTINNEYNDQKDMKVAQVDPFDPAALRISHTSDESLGVEKPLLSVRVGNPNKQDFFRVNPDPETRVDVRIIVLSDTRDTYIVTPEIASNLTGETKLVRLTTCIGRFGGVFLWPVPLQTDDKRENTWHMTARAAAELAETCWVRMQANMSIKAYEAVTSTSIPDPVWPKYALGELLAIAFGDGRLIDRIDHPVVRQLSGQV